MKTRFFILRTSLIAIFCIFWGISAAAESDSVSVSTTVALDTIRTTFTDGSPARMYTVQHGTDIREGLAISYHPNGKVAIEAPYVNGKLDGVFRSYFENGKLWQAIGYKDGIEEGFTTTYYENGAKKKKESYHSGLLHGATEEYYEDGKLRRTLPYILGMVHGVAKAYDSMGALTEEMSFEQGLRNGPYRKYNKGVKVFEAKFERNRCVENCDF